MMDHNPMEPGHTFNPYGRKFVDLPTKKIGRHRFVAIASYVLNYEQVKAMHGHTTEAEEVYLDQENLWDLSIGCIDCEEPYSVDMKNYCGAPAYNPPRKE